MQRKNVKETVFSKNLRLYYASICVIVLGYIFLAIGDADSFTSKTLGPIILVLGYIIAVPIALLSGVLPKKDKSEPQ